MVDPAVWVAVISGIFGITTVMITGAMRRRVAEVHEQVKNTHTTNMREDIDRLLTGYEQVLGTLRAVARSQHRLQDDMSAVRADLRVEREERLALAKRLDVAAMEE